MYTGTSARNSGPGSRTPSLCCSLENLVWSPSKATTSPSTTKSAASWADSASAISGYVPVTSCWLRVISRSRDPARNARQRSPSNLRSKIHPGSETLSLVRVASSGSSQSGWLAWSGASVMIRYFHYSLAGQSAGGGLLPGIRDVHDGIAVGASGRARRGDGTAASDRGRLRQGRGHRGEDPGRLRQGRGHRGEDTGRVKRGRVRARSEMLKVGGL